MSLPSSPATPARRTEPCLASPSPRLRRWLPLASLALAFLAGRTEATELRWWKGNLHTHTLWSDGDGFPEMVAEWYRTNGYHFLALSDHNVLSQGERWMNLSSIVARTHGPLPTNAPASGPAPAVDPLDSYVARFGTNWVETRPGPDGALQVRLKPLEEYRAHVEEAQRFLLIPAEEITVTAANRRAIHLGVVNLLQFIPPPAGATVAEVIARSIRDARDAAQRDAREILVHVNHPNYKWGVTAEDLAGIVEEPFFEVWNGVDGDQDPGDDRHPSTDELWDIANTLRLAALNVPPLFALATDDAHDYHGTKTRALPGRAWVMVRARFLTPESLVRALRAGDFYATTGVLLDEITHDPAAGTLSLRITPSGDETFVTRFIGTRQGVHLQGRPRLDASGKVLETTLDYRAEGRPVMGEVLAEVPGPAPSYRLRGDELYVRAVVISSGRPAVPSTEFPSKRAWTQPVGWRLRSP